MIGILEKFHWPCLGGRMEIHVQTTQLSSNQAQIGHSWGFSRREWPCGAGAEGVDCSWRTLLRLLFLLPELVTHIDGTLPTFGQVIESHHGSNWSCPCKVVPSTPLGSSSVNNLESGDRLNFVLRPLQMSTLEFEPKSCFRKVVAQNVKIMKLVQVSNIQFLPTHFHAKVL